MQLPENHAVPSRAPSLPSPGPNGEIMRVENRVPWERRGFPLKQTSPRTVGSGLSEGAGDGRAEAGAMGRGPNTSPGLCLSGKRVRG